VPLPSDQKPFLTQPLEPWFLARVTAVVAGSPQGYEFEEWWLLGDGTWEAKTGGRIADSTNPGYALPAADLSEVLFSVGDFALVRAGDGAGGQLWEMLPANPDRVFHARLTTSSGGLWKWVRLKSTAGVWSDDGAESATYSASPLAIDGTNLCNPVAGLRVLMIRGRTQLEFIPFGYAASTFPGLVSNTAQTFSGAKTFESTVIANSLESDNRQLELRGPGSAADNPDTVFYATTQIGSFTAFASVGNYDTLEIGGLEFVYPVYDDVSQFANYGTPLSVSGYVASPELRVYWITTHGFSRALEFTRLVADYECVDKPVLYVNGFNYDATTLSLTSVRVPVTGTYRVSAGSAGSDYVGRTFTFLDQGGNTITVKGGIIVDAAPENCEGGSGSGPDPGCDHFDPGNVLDVAVSAKTGDCTCLPDTFQFDGGPGLTWGATPDLCARDDFPLILGQGTGTNCWWVAGEGVTSTFVSADEVTNTIVVDVTFAGGGSVPCTGTARLTITGP
jgi:hypothetical protein